LVFVPQEPAQPFAPDQAGKVLLGADAYDTFEVLNWPQSLIERLRPLKDHPYADQSALETAIQARITPREWQYYQNPLRAASQQVPARLSLGGTLRLTLNNSTPRPLLVQVRLDTWRGRFQDAPQPLYTLLQPGDSSRSELPVRLIAPVDPGQVRVDARIREVNNFQALATRKLYVPVRR
ncbi:MAG TPA: hypothetical protein VL359_12195, partial [bacterium]|nr:hypothetical protein [bacterium]